MNAILQTLFALSIDAAILTAIIIVYRLVFRKAPKWINCVLWGIAGLRLVIPFNLTSVFGLLPSHDIAADSGKLVFNTGIQSIDNTVNYAASAVTYSPVSTDVPVTEASVQSSNPLFFIWLAGLAAMLVFAAVSYAKIYGKVRASVKLRDNVFICDDIDTPFILGIFRPKIYLPSGLDKAKRENILAHENAHIIRKDNLWKPLGFLLLSVYWFNPVIWLAYILLCRDIELACDEKVIKAMNKTEIADYSQVLLECSRPRRMVTVCPLAFGEVGVKQRIKSALNYKKPAFWIVLIAVLAGIAVAVCFGTSRRINTETPIPDNITKDCLPMTYVCVENENVKSYFTVNPADKTFSYSDGVLGKYERTDTAVKLTSDDGKQILCFDRENDTYVFSAEKSQFKGISDKTVFHAEPVELEDTVNKITLARNPIDAWQGECNTAGCFIYGTEETDGKSIIYALVRNASFCFFNGYFMEQSGMLAPAAITLDRFTGDYSVQYPMDGSLYAGSIEKMFPAKYRDKVMNDSGEENQKIWNDITLQAQKYLDSIGRKAQICQYGDIEHVLFTDIGMPVEVSNNFNLKDYYPNEIGNREIILDGRRYMFSTQFDSENKTIVCRKLLELDIGCEEITYDLMTGKRLSPADGTYVQKFENGEPKLLSQKDEETIKGIIGKVDKWEEPYDNLPDYIINISENECYTYTSDSGILTNIKKDKGDGRIAVKLSEADTVMINSIIGNYITD